MEEEVAVRLPGTDLSTPLRSFLGENFQAEEDLSRSPKLELELRKRCSDLEKALGDLKHRLSGRILSYASLSERTGNLLGGIREGLLDLRSCVAGPFLDGGEGKGSGRCDQILAEELPALAREVSRVETVRAYAETALKLDSLIGEVENAVSSSLAGKLRSLPTGTNPEEMRLMAISSLRNTEDVLASIAISRPQWTRLVSAVDDRVDRALAILRPQAIADHRSLLVSLGWPPPLSSSILNSSAGGPADLLNPLLTMKGNLKSRYCESFLALCNLQEFQRMRRYRQLRGYNLKVALHQPLWAIEELVNPIALVSERHFSKWIDKPEFIFALIYKITRDFVDSMDDILQPLVDKARLAGYSCREEWISAMVTYLSTFLAKEIFPTYIRRLEEQSSVSISSQARIPWLNLVDAMITFDKRIQSMITNSGILLSIREDESLQRLSSLSVFCDRPDWLELWAEMELGDTLDKSKPEMQNEINWKMKIKSTLLMSVSEDHKSPAISGAILQCLSMLVDRARPLPSISLRARFIRRAGAPIIQEFIHCLFHRCQEAEGLTALADDDALIKVSNSINAARYCESVLTEWSEDVFFLELVTSSCEDVANEQSSIFEEEIDGLVAIRSEWLEKISTVILRGFDARCRDYLKSKKQWQEKADGWTVSKALVGALDCLQGQVAKLEDELNEMDFVGLWRSLAAGVDQLLFVGILGSNTKFYDGGVERFQSDMEVLFGVFRAWCLRPEGFFPRLSDGLRLLRMGDRELKEGLMKEKEKWLKANGIRHLTTGEAEKIAKNRVFVR